MQNFLAVCHRCQHQHALTLDAMLNTAAIRDWEMKHRGHEIEFLSESGYERSIASHAVHEYRHNADLKLAYASSVDYTITLASLATSSSILTGQQSTSVDNSSNKYLDFLLAGKVTTGTNPTVSKTIEVIALGPRNATPTWHESFGSTDAARSFALTNTKAATARYVATMLITATSDTTYPFGPVSLASLFGVNPPHHIIWVGHDTAVNLNATAGNHAITYTPVYATVT